LSPVIQAVALDDFFPKAQHTPVARATFDRKHGKWSTDAAARPDFTVPPGNTDPNTTYDMVPADFNQVYNVKPLWQRRDALRGAGQTVVVLERTNVLPDDVARFRRAFLPADAKGTFSILHPINEGEACADPGRNGDEGEAALDAEWAGAAAPDADVVLASCADYGASFGPFTAGVGKDYTASTTATVISTAGDAALSVSDPSATATGRLVNGTFALAQPLKARASSPGGTGSAFAPLSTTAPAVECSKPDRTFARSALRWISSTLSGQSSQPSSCGPANSIAGIDATVKIR